MNLKRRKASVFEVNKMKIILFVAFSSITCALSNQMEKEHHFNTSEGLKMTANNNSELHKTPRLPLTPTPPHKNTSCKSRKNICKQSKNKHSFHRSKKLEPFKNNSEKYIGKIRKRQITKREIKHKGNVYHKVKKKQGRKVIQKRRKKDGDEIYIDGDLILGGLFPMHEAGMNDEDCGDIKEEKGRWLICLVSCLVNG